MKMRKHFWLCIVITFYVIIIYSCKKDPLTVSGNLYNPQPYQIDYPAGMLGPDIPAANPMTVQGVKLGRMLFYEKRLSGDNTMSCASCHFQVYGFTDKGSRYSKGIDGVFGDRNSMPIFNLAWEKSFFWDGGSPNLESQVVGPLTSPIEMHSDFGSVVKKLQAEKDYPALFFDAFGTDSITSSLLMKAIAQFERSVTSFNAPFDINYPTQKIREYALQNPKTRIDSGFMIFALEDTSRVHPGHCWHCHGSSPSTRSYTDFQFHNNGLIFNGVDSGRMRITLNPFDRNYFKTPTLRNLAFTAPYMHDGRFKTLDEVIDHYVSGVETVGNTDPFAVKDFSKPLRLTQRDKENLKLFLLSLSDSSLLNNPAYKNPF